MCSLPVIQTKILDTVCQNHFMSNKKGVGVTLHFDRNGINMWGGYVYFTIRISVRSTTSADRDVVHHVATGVCEEPDSTEPVWSVFTT